MSTNIERIIADLRSERDRLDRAIGALEGGRRYSAGTPSRRRRRMSAARLRCGTVLAQPEPPNLETGAPRFLPKLIN
jgi:hypothetical protein